VLVQGGRRLHQVAQRLDEPGAGRTVDHGVVEAQRERQHRSGLDGAVDDHGPVDDGTDGDDRERQLGT
jgi:hypothetical protein